MAHSQFSFTAEVWEHEGAGGWHFVSLPDDVAEEIEAMFGPWAGGFGSHRVEVSIGGTHWSTSIFPDRERETYVLPVNKEVRAAEGLAAGGRARIALVILDE